MKSEVRIEGYRAGGIGRMTQLHGEYYAKHWQFGLFFEAKVASELASLLSRFDPQRDGFWLALLDDEIVGGIALDGQQAEPDVARVRFFILSEQARGLGVGKRLMQVAVAHGRAAGFGQLFLTTFAGLDAARHLYETFGFVLTDERDDTTWGVTVREQRFDLTF